MPDINPGILQRFWSKVEKTKSCWIWIAYLDKDGYGIFRFHDKVKAHRFSYELFNGEILKGLQIDHLCRNRACVNPEHLEAVDCKENILRGLTGSNNFIKTHCPKGHPYSGDNLYLEKNGARHCITCIKYRDSKRKRIKQ